MMQIDRIILFDAELRKLWRSGELVAKWAREHPAIFDADDVAIAQNQCARGAHFAEWYAAIEIYKRYGLLSLVEKYQYKKHRQKGFVLNRLGVTLPVVSGAQYPDLLVYAPDFSEWGLVEVKTDSDVLRLAQARAFAEIERKIYVKIQYLTLISLKKDI